MSAPRIHQLLLALSLATGSIASAQPVEGEAPCETQPCDESAETAEEETADEETTSGAPAEQEAANESEATENSEESEAAATESVEANETAEATSASPVSVAEESAESTSRDVEETMDREIIADESEEEYEEYERYSDYDEDEDESPLHFELNTEFRVRTNAMSDIPLMTVERTGFAETLGQNYWTNLWVRLTSELSYGDHFAIRAQVDVVDGVAFGDRTSGVEAARRPRNDDTAFTLDGLQLRWLYIEWMSKIGLFRMGLQPSQWGLGLIANDGTTEPVFGDYRYGNSNLRLFFATRPFGADVPITVALAGDMVLEDPIARLTQGDRALQGVLALLIGSQERGAGAYVVYRNQTSRVAPVIPDGTGFEESLNVVIADLFARWTFDAPGDGEIYAAFEGAFIIGDTTLTRSTRTPEQDVRQGLFAAQVGYQSDRMELALEGGYTSGDSNAEDNTQRRATMHPDHRIGLILFPELLAWQTARASSLAQSDVLTGRASPGTQLLPTDGGVSGATYLFQYAIFHPLDQLDLRLGWVWARATSDVADPYQQRAFSRNRNYRGGDSSRRDLGFEIDAAIIGHFVLPGGIDLSVGFEGGVVLPGRAFDDALGGRLSPIGMGRLRLGVDF